MPIRKRVHEGTELGNSLATIFTFGDNLVEGGAVAVSITLANKSSSRRRATVHLIPSGGSADDNNCIFDEYIPPNRTVAVPGGPWWRNSGAFIQAGSDASGSAVGITVTPFEEYIV